MSQDREGFWVVFKALGREHRAYETVNKLMTVLSVVSVSEADIRKALSLGLKDFEDALQLVCAKRIKADFLITRNKEDFQDGLDEKIIVDPEEFLSIWRENCNRMQSRADK